MTPELGPPIRSRSMRTPVVGRAVTLLVLLCVAWPGGVAAQPDEENRLAAQTLFEEGQALKKEGDHEAACKKFAASQKLDPAIGTQLNLADCYERVGRTASAWINFVEVASRAKKEGAERRAKIARERADGLKPKLCRMRVDVTTPVDGLQVKRSGKLVVESAWGSATPVDPGSYEMSASAPGKKGWNTTVEVEGEGAEVTVEVPPLHDAPVIEEGDEDAEPRPVAAESEGSGQTIAGIVVGVIGLGGIALGAAFAGISHAKYDESLEHCTTGEDLCSAEGVELRDEAQIGQAIYITSFAVGGVALVTGLILLLTAPSATAGDDESGEETATLRLVPAVGPGGVGLQVIGRF